MLPSVRMLLTEIIDYAGLFPPAALTMSEAFDRYLAHLEGPDGWMMARFVCPASRLGELSPMVGRLREDRPGLTLSVLGRGGGTPDLFSAGITSDLHDIASFRAAVGSRVLVDQFEVRLPGPPVELTPVTTLAAERLGTSVPAVATFFEVSLLDAWRSRLPEAAEAVNAALAKGLSAGLKIRCGGLEPAAVPSPVAVAAAIATCRRRAVPLKATQGLHHPIRHFDSVLETTVHGFLNIFVAGVLAHAHQLDEDTLLGVLLEEDPSAFRVGPNGVAWHHLEADTNQISASRKSGVTSFGSCSFKEPLDDLRVLGLLEPETAAPSN